MAKKKVNYTKTTGKAKPRRGFTEKDKKQFLAALAAAVVIILCMVYLPDVGRRLHNKGVEDMLPDNALLCNTGTLDKPSYHQVALLDPIDGFVLDSVNEGSVDKKLRSFRYMPIDENNPLQRYVAQVFGFDAQTVVHSEHDKIYPQMATKILSDSGILEEEVAEKKCYMYVLSYTYPTETAEGEKTDTPIQIGKLYLDTKYTDRCICITIENAAQSEGEFPEDALLFEALRSIADKITLTGE